MSAIPASVIQRMVAAGLNADQIGEVCAAIAEGFSQPVPEITHHDLMVTRAGRAERRRMLDRERKQRVRKSAEMSARHADTDADIHADNVAETLIGKAFSDADARADNADIAADIGADAAAEIPPQERFPQTPSKESPSLPSGDKSPSGDSPRAPTREASAEPDFDEPDFALAAAPPPAVVDAEFEEVGTPGPRELFADPAAGRALALVKPERLIPIDTPEFERFWRAYPRKIGKGEARKAFARAARKIAGPEPPIEVMLHSLAAAVQSWAAEGREARHIPHATTWLNQERWTDEHDPRPGTGARQPEQDRRIQQMVGGAALLADRIRRRQGGG